MMTQYSQELYSYLAVGVDLEPDGGVLVQVVLAHSAGPGDSGLQGGAVLQVKITTINLIITVIINDVTVT